MGVAEKKTAGGRTLRRVCDYFLRILARNRARSFWVSTSISSPGRADFSSGREAVIVLLNFRSSPPGSFLAKYSAVASRTKDERFVSLAAARMSRALYVGMSSMYDTRLVPGLSFPVLIGLSPFLVGVVSASLIVYQCIKCVNSCFSAYSRTDIGVILNHSSAARLLTRAT